MNNANIPDGKFTVAIVRGGESGEGVKNEMVIAPSSAENMKENTNLIIRIVSRVFRHSATKVDASHAGFLCLGFISTPLVRGWKKLRLISKYLMSWWRGVNRMDDYRNYLVHQHMHHPGESVLSEAEFWRNKWEEANRNPQARCC